MVNQVVEESMCLKINSCYSNKFFNFKHYYKMLSNVSEIS